MDPHLGVNILDQKVRQALRLGFGCGPAHSFQTGMSGECGERKEGKSKRRTADGVFPGIYWKCSSWLNTCSSSGISQGQDTQGSGFQGDLDL